MHHRLIARKLEAVERGDIRRLMIFVPPRHGKSMLASEYFPAWYLGRNPSNYVIAATYAQDLADDFGRKVRNQIADPAFGLIFPGVGVVNDSTSAKRFHVTQPLDVFRTGQNGAYFAVGVGGPLTGRGAHLLLIDDPVKNREEADSETIREKTKDWYTSTAYTRLMPGGRIVVIQTRWHEDDLAGWLLTEHAHENWDVLDLPAINSRGEALWPDQYPLPALEQIRRAIGPRDWSALYQQRPTPEEGDYFRREWFKTYQKLPDGCRFYGASDYAVTADGGDFTVHIVVAVDREGNIHVVDVWRGQTTSDIWIERLLDLVEKHKPLKWAEEQGQIIKSVGPFLVRRMRERRVYCAREQFTSALDKPTRARSIQARMAMGMVLFKEGAPWLADLFAELLSFDAGKTDDQVDTLSLIGRLMDTMTGKSVEKKKPELDRYDRAFAKAERGDVGSWKTL